MRGWLVYCGWKGLGYIVGHLICHGRGLAGSSCKYKLLYKHTQIVILNDIIFICMIILLRYNQSI